MSIIIDAYELYYKTKGSEYIITYKSEYNLEIDNIIDNIFNAIFPHYTNSTKGLQYSNVCGANAEFICKNLKIEGIKLGKLIMANWIPTTKITLDKIEKIYGITGLSIGLSYHALAYLELIIDGNTNYIAIETTICQPYKLQFYIGTNNEEFENIIKTRYQCSDFNVSFECDKNWWEISLPRGGTKQKMKRKNKNKTKIKNKKRKQKTKKKRKQMYN